MTRCRHSNHTDYGTSMYVCICVMNKAITNRLCPLTTIKPSARRANKMSSTYNFGSSASKRTYTSVSVALIIAVIYPAVATPSSQRAQGPWTQSMLRLSQPLPDAVHLALSSHNFSLPRTQVWALYMIEAHAWHDGVLQLPGESSAQRMHHGLPHPVAPIRATHTRGGNACALKRWPLMVLLAGPPKPGVLWCRSPPAARSECVTDRN